MTTQDRIAELEYCIAKATENIRKADKLGHRTAARLTRRDRDHYRAELARLQSGYTIATDEAKPTILAQVTFSEVDA